MEVLATETLGGLRKKIAEQCGMPAFEQQLVCGTDVVEERYGTLDDEPLQKILPMAGGVCTVTVVRVVTPVSVEDLVRRKTAQLLVTGCPRSLEKFHAEVVLQSPEHLELVFGIIAEKASQDPFTSRLYIDILHSLHLHYPEFPPPSPGDRPVSFKGLLHKFILDRVRNQATGRAAERLKITHSFMKLVGLILEEQLAVLFLLSQLSYVLIGALDTQIPPQHLIHCFCTLLESCGRAMEERCNGGRLVSFLTFRLRELQEFPGYSSETIDMIEDLVQLQANQWVRF